VTATSDIPTDLEFVDPDATDPTFRVVLWAAPGQGKSVAAASAPRPILVVSADRPSAYGFARKHHQHTKDTLREVRYRGVETLGLVYRYLAENPDIRTVIVDPVSNVVDQLADAAPAARDGGPDYQWINKKILGFVKSLRSFDVNVVLVGHEKINDGKGGDGKLYPALGGPTLINKLLAEMDIVAHVERVPKPTEDDPGAAVWIGQIQPRDNLVTKDGTDALGDRRIADLSRWFEVASVALAPDVSDLPWEDGPREDEPTPGELADAADAVANAPRQPQIEADDSDPANHPPEVEPGPGQFDVGPS
jgi:hypothetical protein